LRKTTKRRFPGRSGGRIHRKRPSSGGQWRAKPIRYEREKLGGGSKNVRAKTRSTAPEKNRGKGEKTGGGFNKTQVPKKNGKEARTGPACKHEGAGKGKSHTKGAETRSCGRTPAKNRETTLGKLGKEEKRLSTKKLCGKSGYHSSGGGRGADIRADLFLGRRLA